MNTEDKFYFGKHGQPERFSLMRVELSDAGRSSTVSTDEFMRYAIANVPGVSRSDFLETMIEKVNAWAKQNGKGVRAKVAVKGMDFSRPGQPERFERRMTSQELGHLRNWISNHARNTDEAVSAMGKMQRIFEDDPEFWEDKGWSAVARAANVLAFSRPGQPEKFAANKQSAIQVTDAEYAALVAADAEMEQWVKYQYDRTPQQKAIRDAGKSAMDSARARLNATHKKWEAASSDAERAQIEKQYAASGRSYKSKHFSRPGQPERFEETSTKPIGQMVLNKIEAALAAGKTVYLSNMMKSIVITPKNYANWKASGTPLFKVDSKGDLRIYQGGKYVVMTSGGLSHVRVDAHSRPGQPERFDASSLDRKGFAEASSSPMLGKLLSEKQMPEGGWRAVETGGGALVISFEDGDVAGNFARRVASNGYSATAPVQSIGRYWNVEVKNG